MKQKPLTPEMRAFKEFINERLAAKGEPILPQELHQALGCNRAYAGQLFSLTSRSLPSDVIAEKLGARLGLSLAERNELLAKLAAARSSLPSQRLPRGKGKISPTEKTLNTLARMGTI